ncbi:methylenetetrahydrofolate reductase (NADPH) [Gemmobacter caeni]|uniref:5,10-methylenetetrahydrofolate reductase n=1 Tax=Gemmobacter caeni TaxID=589035 RepID=A0A2T6ADF3_9RHOB|nr:5,10-methylenetetrahydrofolate reductase [Gemmobacter caeni]PTX41802.1 5,10-methylenetetrahydrofolate reductase [Gemmobacter caeni]TWI90635.1 methylenetetrahydrofolate reductase (NADPH) [Gemmobacter caeni]
MTQTNLAKTAETPRLIDGDVSIELAPEMVAKFHPDPGLLPAGSKVFLTHLSGKDPAIQVAAARGLLDMGYVPVVHIGARNFDSEAAFVSFIQAHRANGVTHGLFLGGNPLKYKGPLGQALDLLSHPVMQDSGFTDAFISGYPEGHPDISVDSLDEARARKIERCRLIGLAPQIVTQFAFDGGTMAAWTARMQRLHPDVPVRLGLAGVTSLPKLIKFAVMCGVGPSIAVLKKNSGGLLNVLTDKDPSDVIAAIEANLPVARGRTDLHFFPFGGWEKTLRWISEARRS